MKLNKKQFFSKLNEGSVKNFTINGIKFFAEDPTECLITVEVSFFPKHSFDDISIQRNYEKLKDKFEVEFIKWINSIWRKGASRSRQANGDRSYGLGSMSKREYNKIIENFEKTFEYSVLDNIPGYYYELDSRKIPVEIVHTIRFVDKYNPYKKD